MAWDIYLISDPRHSRGQTNSDIITQAVCAGIQAIELNDQLTPTERLIEVGRIVREITRNAKATYIVNGRLDVAVAVEADGARVPVDDVPMARVVLGPRRLILASVTNLDESLRAEQAGADYIVVGPVFVPDNGLTKRPPAGVSTIATVKQAVSVPVIAVGGITPVNVRDVVAAGADSIAVSTFIVGSTDIPQAVRTLRQAMRSI